MRRDQLRGEMSDPVVKRNFLKFASSEHFQNYQIGVARVLDIMPRDPGHKSDVICIEVHGVRALVCKHGHTRFTSKVVLPFRGVRMPVQFTQAAWLNSY